MLRPAHWLVGLWMASSMLACTRGPNYPLASQAKTPEDVLALFDRETELPGLEAFRDPEGRWAARAPATASPQTSREEDYILAKVPFGAEEPMECYFYDEMIDAGQAVTMLLGYLNEGLELVHVAPYRIARAGDMPVVFLDGRYFVESPEGKMAGGVKVAVSSRFDTSVLCVHDEPGFTETFAGAVTTLLDNLVVFDAHNPSSFSEIWAFQMGDIPVGFEVMHVLQDDSGNTLTLSIASSFVPTGPGQLATSDRVDITTTNSSGVLSGKMVEIEGTDTTYELDLNRTSATAYRVQGKVQGKPFDTTFEAPRGLAHSVGTYRYLQSNRGKYTSLSVDEYVPGTNPGGTTRATYVLEGDRLHSTAGQSHVVGQIGSLGLPDTLVLPMGAREFRGVVIHRAGSL